MRYSIVVLLAVLLGPALAAPVALDSVYLLYAHGSHREAYGLLQRLAAQARRDQRFAVDLEIGDYYLDKAHDYARAESIYASLVEMFPRHRQLPDVLYRLALAQELQEKFLDAARNYEKVATRYSKSRYGSDALDAIERCFRKNYQDRVAYVNGFPITRIELDDRISRNPSAYEPYERKQQLLDTMIDTRLLYEAALAAGVANDPAFVFNIGEVRNRLMLQRWYEREVNARSEPTEQEVRSTYRRDRSKYTTPERVHAFRILVDTREAADSLRRLLIADTSKRPSPYPVRGEDSSSAVPVSALWDSLAKLRSKSPDRAQGGDMGLFARGVHPKALENAAFRLKPGQVSQPIRLEDGWALLWVVRKAPKTVRRFEEVKPQIAAELRQNKINTVFEQQIARLRTGAKIVQDSTAVTTGRETLAVVDGVPITGALLQERLNAIPPYFRGQFETPEGKQRVIDQLILERLLRREAERSKLWLDNQVVDQLLARRQTMLIDSYKRQMVTDKAVVDSATLMRDYLANIKDFREPTRAHCREMVVKSLSRANQLRRWAVANRVPAMVSGRALLVTADSVTAARLMQELAATDNPDTLVSRGCLASPPVVLPGRPQVSVGGRSVPDLAAESRLTGPFVSHEWLGFGFTDVTAEDRLYAPEVVTVEDTSQLRLVLEEAELSGPAASVIDTARLGRYVRLQRALPSSFVRGLFQLDSSGMAPVQRVDDGWLLVKVTRRDSAKSVEFAELVRRFSTSGSRWAGGEMWLTRDDNSRDAKVVRAVYALSPGSYSRVIRLNDSTFTFVKLEEMKKAYTRPFSEVRGKIEPKLRRQKEAELYSQLLADLRAKADIEVVMKPSDFQLEMEPAESTAPAGEQK